MSNSGQSCDAPTRMLVERPIYEKVVEEAVDEASKINLDSPNKKGDHIGPVVSKVQYDKIINLINLGIQEGANLAIGGPEKPNGLEKGYFIKPTIFTNVTNDMEIAKSEIFGPVLSIIPFDTEEEAIRIVNDTEYGLGNYIQTNDLEKAQRVAKKLRSGVVYINGNSMDSGTPFGGYRQSGNGREGGKWGLEEYLEVKTITGWV
jgi:aldehyde dehydrogenase (NAD+)